MADGEFTVELLTLLMVFRRETRQRPHLVLAGGDRHFPVSERDRVHELLHAELNQLGLADGPELVPEIRHVLDVLQHAEVEYFGWVQHEDERFALLAAGIGEEALLLSRAGDEVRLSPFHVEHPGELVAHFIERLPDLPGAQISPFTIAEAELPRADGPTPHAVEAQRMDELFTLRRSGGGQLYTAVRDRAGERHQSPDKLDYLDTSAGRVLSYFTESAGVRELNIAPGSPERLAGKLVELQQTA